MMSEAFRLFRALAVGEPINGMRFAADAGISRSAVWKQVEQLRAAGLPVNAVRGSGYRLAWPIDPLEADAIRRAAGVPDMTVEVVDCTGSTNLDLTDRFVHRHLRAAEFQTGGRGRRGRGWISPPGCGACFSFGYRFDCGLQRLGALSLVAGVAAAEAVAHEGVRVGLKWPNDLVVDGIKLGGLLVEIRGASEGPCEVVTGVGINVRLPREATEASGFIPPDQPWTDLYAASEMRDSDGDMDRGQNRKQSCYQSSNQSFNRNRLIGRLAGALDAAFKAFERDGFDPFTARWRRFDALQGRSVRVLSGNAIAHEGVAVGVDRLGQLQVECRSGIKSINAGEVSVRAN